MFGDLQVHLQGLHIRFRFKQALECVCVCIFCIYCIICIYLHYVYTCTYTCTHTHIHICKTVLAKVGLVHNWPVIVSALMQGASCHNCMKFLSKKQFLLYLPGGFSFFLLPELHFWRNSNFMKTIV